MNTLPNSTEPQLNGAAINNPPVSGIAPAGAQTIPAGCVDISKKTLNEIQTIQRSLDSLRVSAQNAEEAFRFALMNGSPESRDSLLFEVAKNCAGAAESLRRIRDGLEIKHRRKPALVGGAS